MGIADRVKRAVEVTSDELAKAVAAAEKTATAKLDAWLADSNNEALAEGYRLAKEQVELRRDMHRRRLAQEQAARQEAERREREGKETRFATLCASLSQSAFLSRLEPEIKEARRIYSGLALLDGAIQARMDEHLRLQAEAFELARALGKPAPAPVFQRRADVMVLVREAIGTFLRLNPELGDDVVNWIAATR